MVLLNHDGHESHRQENLRAEVSKLLHVEEHLLVKMQAWKSLNSLL
jgi:hypothetical protein